MSTWFRCLVVIGFGLLLNSSAFSQEATQEQPTETTQTEPTDQKSEGSSSGDLNSSRPEILPPIDKLEQQKSDLTHFLPTEEFSEVLAQAQSYTIAISTHETPQNKGTVILLPDWQQALTNPHAINFLKASLPTIGWTTLTVAPPSMPENYPSIALSKTEREEQDSESLKTYQQFLVALFEQLYQKAKSYPGVIVVLAQGNHALLLPKLFNEEMLDTPAAFIMLSAYSLTDETNTIAAQQVSLSEVPILDLYLRRDNYLVANAAKLRSKYTTQELTPGYRQRALNNITPSYYPAHRMLTEIKGWLYSIGW